MPATRAFPRHWVYAGFTLYGLYVLLPWLAPVFMHQGWTTPARWIYTAYSVVCHQLPQRSYFLFGPEIMYSLEEIQAAYRPTTNPLLLRAFVGTPEMGWKVAWSDRMVSMYTPVLPLAWLAWRLRHRWRPWPGWVLALLVLPLAVDGTTHLISDALYGLGQGFRYTNTWLARLTGYAFPATFYVGDAVGSFNWWMRLLSGLAFAVAMVGGLASLWQPQTARARTAVSPQPPPREALWSPKA